MKSDRCEKVRGVLLQEAAGSLDPALPLEVEAHLGECEDCARFDRELRAAFAALNPWQEEPADEADKARAVVRIRGRLVQRKHERRALGDFVFAFAWLITAGILLLAGMRGGWAFLRDVVGRTALASLGSLGLAAVVLIPLAAFSCALALLALKRNSHLYRGRV